ncbi:MAG: radical SAM family heme chaperone HemW [Lachnospiraceae bacterium]|nr:radical SAM family heme chaperone HemW [Lachnospiraceae bacterium]
MELYIHIPFCIRKCAYCDFLSAPADQDTVAQYMDALKKQLVSQAASFQNQVVDTVFVGGGTPTVLSAGQLSELLETVQMNYVLAEDVEFTVEANPGTLTAGKVRALTDGGVNRVSLGLQSASEQELRLLGRIHTYDDFLRSYELLREAGIHNLNVDLMSALPGQTVISYEKTLHQVLSLHPEHISAYSLIIEEGTPFYEQYREDEKLRDAGEEPQFLPSEESERAMYELTGELLADYGYVRYEISNYAKDGFSCRHNIGYWTGVDYFGAGLGASSYIEGSRFCNTSDLSSYLAGDFAPREVQHLSKNDHMAEFFYLGLRMTAGVAKAEFVRRFGMGAEAVYGDVLKDLVDQELLEDTGTHYRLTPFGRDVSNQVLYRFL